MSDSAKAGKVPAVLLAVPGASIGWHFVDGVRGLFHPEVPVPSVLGEEFVKAHKSQVADAHKAWDEFEVGEVERGFRQNGVLPFPEPPCPLKVVQVSETKAEDGLELAAAARGRAVKTLRETRRATPGDVSLAHDEKDAIAGGEE